MEMTCDEYESSPFFIIGAQRSGTTMLRLMLNSHPDIAIPFESTFIPGFYYDLHKYGQLEDRANTKLLLDAIAADPWVCRGQLIPDYDAVLARDITSYSGMVDAIFTEYARHCGKKRWGDKTPDYLLDMDVLWKLFPGSRFIHLVRDGRDVALSLAGVSWGSNHVPRVAEDWLWKTTLAHKMGTMIPDNYLEIHYEDLVRTPEKILSRICDFIGEPFHESMLHYYQDGAQNMPAESIRWHKSSISAPDIRKIYSWKEKMSLSDRLIFEDIAGPALDMYGYERSEAKLSFAVKLKKLWYTGLRRW